MNKKWKVNFLQNRCINIWHKILSYPIYLSIWYSSLSIYLSIYLILFIIYLSIWYSSFSIYLFIYLSESLDYLSMWLFIIYLSSRSSTFWNCGQKMLIRWSLLKNKEHRVTFDFFQFYNNYVLFVFIFAALFSLKVAYRQQFQDCLGTSSIYQSLSSEKSI